MKRSLILCIASLFWLGSLITLIVFVYQGPSGWDTQVYWTAAQSIRHGGDPYAEGIAVQQAFHQSGSRDTHFPMTYVYSPATLLLLRAVAQLPAWLACAGYYLLLAVAIVLQLWAAWQMASPEEQRWLPLAFPAVVFFPGLLYHDVIMSGNIAYLIYGAVLATAVPGFKRGRWLWFYVAVLAASFLKAPLLTLLAFPVLVGRRQWIPAAFSGALGVGLFAVQGWLWPGLFAEYVAAVQLQFDWNRDFGFSPSGMLGQALSQMGVTFTVPCELCYLCFAAVLALALIVTACRANSTQDTRALWIPVALVGTVLLNPRIKEYDVAALTIPMLLVLVRFAPRALEAAERFLAEYLFVPCVAVQFSEPSPWRYLPAFLGGLGWFVAINILAGEGSLWKPTELVLLLATAGAGLWTVCRECSEATDGRPVSIRLPKPGCLTPIPSRTPVSEP